MLTFTEDDTNSTNHEVVTDNLEIGISIKNLTKVFGRVSPYTVPVMTTYNRM